MADRMHSRLRLPQMRLPFAVRMALRLVTLLLAVSFITFLLVGLSPIDPVQANVGQAAVATMSPERRIMLAEHWDVGVPILERYASWLGDAVHGDLGESLRFGRPVVEVVGERLQSSALLLGASWLISGVVGLALGVLAGVRAGTRLDRVIRGYCYVLSAAPTFWIALVALMVFAVYLGWFPVGFSVPIGSVGEVSLAARLHHMVAARGSAFTHGCGKYRPAHTRENGRRAGERLCTACAHTRRGNLDACTPSRAAQPCAPGAHLGMRSDE